jgi:hypothetical protein
MGEVAPCTAFGTATGPSVPVRLTRVHGAHDRHAARMLGRKHPFLHGVLVPLAHRVLRAKTGRTVHFEVVPIKGSDRAYHPDASRPATAHGQRSHHNPGR